VGWLEFERFHKHARKRLNGQERGLFFSRLRANFQNWNVVNLILLQKHGVELRNDLGIGYAYVSVAFWPRRFSMTNPSDIESNELREHVALHLRYLDIQDSDIQLLRDLKPIIHQHKQALVDGFYAHLQAFEGTRSFLSDPAVLARLLEAQRVYLRELFEANFDEAYYQKRRGIGHVHFRIGLDFQWYIGAYSVYLELLQGIIWKHFELNDPRVPASLNAVRKAALLDMTIVLEAFHEGHQQALQSSQAQVLHQEKLATVGLLTSGLAHEIGNPLASIMAICDNQIHKRELPPPIHEKFERIKQLVLRVNSIVRQLVSFAKPDQEQWQAVQLNDIVVSALDMAKLAKAAQNVNVKLVLDAALPNTIGSRDQLAQVFLNLLLNAFDALNKPVRELTIRTVTRSTDLAVSIEDNGQGIAMEHISKLFTAFFTTKEVGQGTGLGLFVSLGIIKRHGGEIQVQSEVGRGSTFTVLLPLRNTPPQQGRLTWE
jgi:C4-dicarboxylate-specific signal transduction histidine kinase